MAPLDKVLQDLQLHRVLLGQLPGLPMQEALGVLLKPRSLHPIEQGQATLALDRLILVRDLLIQPLAPGLLLDQVLDLVLDHQRLGQELTAVAIGREIMLQAVLHTVVLRVLTEVPQVLEVLPPQDLVQEAQDRVLDLRLVVHQEDPDNNPTIQIQ